MGMYDEILCDYPIGAPEVQDDLWQSKDLDCRLDEYKIHADGTLWHEACEEGVAIDDSIHRDPHWVQVSDFCGELEIHTSKDKRWYSVRFWFRDGMVNDLIMSVSDLPGGGQDAKLD